LAFCLIESVRKSGGDMLVDFEPDGLTCA
jgi:hypothetical protein